VQNPTPLHAVRTALSSVATDGFDDVPIVVHSHLRWDFVWQRPQQILTRLARHHPVAFVEEPMFGDDDAHLVITAPHKNVVRIVPMLPHAARGDVDRQGEAIAPMLEDAFDEHPLLARRFDEAIEWFYTPMAARTMLGRLGSVGVVYDCMDELAQFRGAPADLALRERELLAHADTVFTGGHQLYARKSRHHRNVHLFGCGVDADHYAKARDATTPLPADVADLPRPVFGYFGVVDERLDYALIAALADAVPHGSVVIVGPSAKVDPAELPGRPNLHWLGPRAYADLPAYTKAFDVCLMPFALNEATENINPTKTLEYMAAGKPVVSTAVADVVRQFTSIVDVGHDHAEFIALAMRAASAPDAHRLARGIERARSATWDAIVDAMRGHMLAGLRARYATTRPTSTAEQEAST
jgi:glycosyltransferase involved in cell wall biosynthesis